MKKERFKKTERRVKKVDFSPCASRTERNLSAEDLNACTLVIPEVSRIRDHILLSPGKFPRCPF